jgi:hypothetical protein
VTPCTFMLITIGIGTRRRADPRGAGFSTIG